MINWVEEMNGKLGIPEKLRDIMPTSNTKHDQDLIDKYRNICHHSGILGDKEILNLSMKAERNDTGFTNFIRYSREDYGRVLKACL